MSLTGQFIVRLPPDFHPDKRTAITLHLVGFDGTPLPSKVTLVDDGWMLQTHGEVSGRIAICWPVPDRGEWLLTTGTLQPRWQPYRLLTELARGTLNRLRNQLEQWKEGGLAVSLDVNGVLQSAIDDLAQAILGNGDADSHAERAINKAAEAMEALCRQFSAHILPLRNQQSQLPRVVVSIRDDLADGSMSVPITTWNSKRCSAAAVDGRRAVMIGPLVDASPEGLSADFRQYGTFEERRQAILKYASGVLKSLPKHVQMIHVMSGLNGSGHRWLSYPQQMQLAVDLLELMDELCPGIDTMVSFDAPWAERLAWSVGGHSPLMIADSLLRRALNVGALGLDIALDYWPLGSLVRDPLQWLELIDIWAQLGLPLVVNLCAPTGLPPPGPASDDLRGPVRRSLTDAQLLRLLDVCLPVIASRPALEGIVWTQRQDGDDPRFPYGGLLDPHGKEKELFAAWHRWRQLITGEHKEAEIR